jgi:hypothetical protein
MIDLVLHDATRAQLESFIAHPSHALLLTGPAGIGKTAVAEALATELLGTRPDSHPYYLIIRPDGLSISIESIRQLQKFLLLKTTGTRPIRRVIVVEHAHALTIEAQNAFLKLLEEPPADTSIILTAHSPRKLLPTILSRAQVLGMHAPTESQSRPMLQASQKDDLAQKQAWFLSGGLPGLLHALLNEEGHPLIESVVQAKSVLQKEPFERLAMVDALSKQKESALGLVEALQRIAQAGLTGAGSRSETARIRQWHHVRKLSIGAQTALQRSANAKLVLANLFLNLH